MGTIREDIEAMFTDDELMEIAGCAEVDAWGDPRNALGLVASWAVHVASSIVAAGFSGMWAPSEGPAI